MLKGYGLKQQSTNRQLPQLTWHALVLEGVGELGVDGNLVLHNLGKENKP